MEPDPAPTAPTPAWRSYARWHWQQLRCEVETPRPVPAGRLERMRYGLAQPFLGLRIILRSSDLRVSSLAPACGVLLFAGVVGYGKGIDQGVGAGLLAFWLAIVALAPVPSVLFGRVYAGLAARARPHLGLDEHQPYVRSVVRLCGEALAQLMVLGLGVALYAGLARWALGSLGVGLAILVQAIWSLHWVVVEGYDNARTLPPGSTVEQLEAEGLARPGEPWFHRWHDAVPLPKLLRRVLLPFRLVSGVTTYFARAWRLEVDLVEQRPWVSLGFGLGVATMLAVPGLNLLFRPAVVVAGVHLRHRLLNEEAALVVAGDTQPYPVIEPAASFPAEG